jgi:purine-nucleoside phosphorylase
VTATADPVLRAAGAAADRLRGEADVEPSLGLVLRGPGTAGDLPIEREARVPFIDLPGFNVGDGSADGGVSFARMGGRPIWLVEPGRDGDDPERSRAAFAVRVLRELGVGILVTSAPCLALEPAWSPGDLGLVSDHLNWTGANPLTGSNVDAHGPRFPDMTEAWDASLRATARRSEAAHGFLREGVYAAIRGPEGPTPAEVRMLRTLGADMVGTEMVGEALVARHAGLRALGVGLVVAVAGQDPAAGAFEAAAARFLELLSAAVSSLTVDTVARGEE